jgi:hypothetical protein
MVARLEVSKERTDISDSSISVKCIVSCETPSMKAFAWWLRRQNLSWLFWYTGTLPSHSGLAAKLIDT